MTTTTAKATLAKHLDASAKATADWASGREQIRQRIADLRKQIGETETQPIALPEAMRRLDQWHAVAKAGGIGELPLFDFIAPQGRDRIQLTPMSSPAFLFDCFISVVADEIKARLATRLEEFYREQPGLAEAERDKRIKALEDELAEIEVAEERLILRAEAAGLPVLRRADAVPEIVLAPDAALAES